MFQTHGGSTSKAERSTVSPPCATAPNPRDVLLQALCRIGPIACRPGRGEMVAADASCGKPSTDWVRRVINADAYALQVDAQSPWESVRLEGPAGPLGLLLLPDTDFLAWDQLLELLARHLPRRAGRIRHDRGPWWICRFESVEVSPIRVIALPSTSLSPCGRCVLNLIQHSQPD